MWQEMWSKIARGHQWREYRWGCVTRLYLHHCHMQQVEGGVSTRVTARGRGTTAHIVPLGQGGRGRGDIRWRGEAAAAQIDFYHDTLTIVNWQRAIAEQLAAARGCEAAECLMLWRGEGGWVGPELGQPRYCHRGWAVSRVTCHVSQVIVKQKLVDNCLHWGHGSGGDTGHANQPRLSSGPYLSVMSWDPPWPQHRGWRPPHWPH